MKDKEVGRINIRLSPKLKDAFDAICEEREVSISDAVRDLIANYVKTYTRKNAKVEEKV